MLPATRPKFIVDANVGKLARWLRMLGFDATFFDQPDDWEMVRTAIRENRVILTRDTNVMKLRVVTTGKIKALLIAGDDPEAQMHQVVKRMNLENETMPFTLCIEDNEQLVPRLPDEVKDRVPPYVYKTQREYVECPSCHRIYWKGTHWQAMKQQLEHFLSSTEYVD